MNIDSVHQRLLFTFPGVLEYVSVDASVGWGDLLSE